MPHGADNALEGDRPHTDNVGSGDGNRNRGDAGAPVRAGVGVISDIRIETEAARHLLMNFRDVLGDEDAADIAIESETNLKEAIATGTRRILELDGMVAGIGAMLATLKERSDRLDRQRVTLRTAINVAMEAAGMKKVELAEATLSLRPVPPSVQIIDESAIPSRFMKPQPPKLDKRAMLDALKAHEPIPGATLSNGGTTLSIRTK